METRVVKTKCWLVVLLCGASVSQAGEPAREFLDQLVDTQLYDVALDYLEQLQDSPLAPVRMKEIIPYEQGRILIKLSGLQRDFDMRERQLNRAQQSLQQFIDTRKGNPKVAAAESELGTLLEQRGTLQVLRAERPGNAQEKQKLLASARERFGEARGVFEKIQGQLRQKLKNYPAVIPTGTPEHQLREETRLQYLQTLLVAAVIQEEMADTYDEKAPERSKLLSEASSEYDSIYKNYRRFVAGLYARLYQGRVQKKLGKFPDAISYLVEILENEDNSDAFRSLKNKALLEAMDCWLDPSEEKYAEAIRQATAWIDSSRQNEIYLEDWLQLRFALARAHGSYSEYLEKKDPADPQIRISRDEAKKQARVVARFSSALKDDAQRLEARYGGRKYDPNKKPDPKTFAEAADAAKQATEMMRTQQLVLQTVPDQIEVETDAKRKEELVKQVENANKTIGLAREDAIRFFNRALELAESGTPPEEVNQARYVLSYLHFEKEDYYEAAVLGEMVARRFPGSSAARHCANLAMWSYRQLYDLNTTEDRDFERGRVMGAARYLSDHWADSSEGQGAVSQLIEFSIRDGKVSQAREYLAKIPEDSQARGPAELKTGRAIWYQFLRENQQLSRWQREGVVPAGIDPAARKQELTGLRDQAQQVLSAGIQRMRGKGSVDGVLATAALSLAQVYSQTGQSVAALKLLEDEQIGPLTLVRAKHAAVATKGFAAETYKSALSSYIGSLGSATSSQDAIGKAKQVMEDLNATVGATADGQTQLMSHYATLAKDLKQQIELADSAAKRQQLTEGFETFLQQVSQGATELNVLHWVADTFTKMGEALEAGNARSKNASRYFTLAIGTYERILTDGGQKDFELTPAVRDSFALQLAKCYRRVRKFTACMGQLESILKERNSLVNVQLEAARTYQLWARFPRKESLYLRALTGGRPVRGKNTVWGFQRISKVTYRHPNLRDAFLESRYRMSECLYEWAVALGKQDKQELKKKRLTSANKALLATVESFALDETWRPQYDGLLRKIQRASGKPVVGLPKQRQKTRQAQARPRQPVQTASQ
ncbi:MAG: hypothetical protein CMJ75_02190 [Planctomycetaceae bacterium]|nr:hypothetical protein [Planctomycetaceae bacterium]